MIERIAMILFVLSFVLCGCGIESIFDGGAFYFLMALLVMVVCAFVITTNED